MVHLWQTCFLEYYKPIGYFPSQENLDWNITFQQELFNADSFMIISFLYHYLKTFKDKLIIATRTVMKLLIIKQLYLFEVNLHPLTKEKSSV